MVIGSIIYHFFSNISTSLAKCSCPGRCLKARLAEQQTLRVQVLPEPLKRDEIFIHSLLLKRISVQNFIIMK